VGSVVLVEDRHRLLRGVPSLLNHLETCRIVHMLSFYCYALLQASLPAGGRTDLDLQLCLCQVIGRQLAKHRPYFLELHYG
jgi:hypothetical protein